MSYENQLKSIICRDPQLIKKQSFRTCLKNSSLRPGALLVSGTSHLIFNSGAQQAWLDVKAQSLFRRDEQILRGTHNEAIGRYPAEGGFEADSSLIRWCVPKLFVPPKWRGQVLKGFTCCSGAILRAIMPYPLMRLKNGSQSALSLSCKVL